MGISKDDIPFIFKRFYRGEKSRNRETGGSGIGLSIAKAIVLAHGGKMNVESEINKGSKFTVKILL
jgi:signal transduction histidine kinase